MPRIFPAHGKERSSPENPGGAPNMVAEPPDNIPKVLRCITPPPLSELDRLPSMRRLVITFFAVLLAPLANAGLARGQAPPIRSRVNEVVLPVTVLDAKGAMVLDLPEGAFHIFDNGEEQTIDGFDLGGDPLAIALVIETSSHIRPMAQAIRNMAIIFTETVMAFEAKPR